MILTKRSDLRLAITALTLSVIGCSLLSTGGEAAHAGGSLVNPAMVEQSILPTAVINKSIGDLLTNQDVNRTNSLTRGGLTLLPATIDFGYQLIGTTGS